MSCCKVFGALVGIVCLLILYAVFFAALIIGASRINACPAEPRLPIWLIIFGSLGIAFGIYVISQMGLSWYGNSIHSDGTHECDELVRKKDADEYVIPPRRLKSPVRRLYPDIEKRITRITDSKRTHDDLSGASNDSSSSRETRMEIAAWIAVCQFDCRIFGGFVRDWIVGGYSAKPTRNTSLFPWITYTREHYRTRNVQPIPHVTKKFVPNDIDCQLPDNDFDIDRFSNELRKYGIQCGRLIRTQTGFVLLLNEDHGPFTMDLIVPKRVLKSRKYSILDMDVNNLYVEKDYLCELGLRWSPNHTQGSRLYDLETIVRNIKNKKFMVLSSNDIKDRTTKMFDRGWTQFEREGWI
ncbi:hypothetical protein I4U23_022716 [Adineta vaga]|nr:hypothetical protein I4U23_022716 [Adineta vaga]